MKTFTISLSLICTLLCVSGCKTGELNSAVSGNEVKLEGSWQLIYITDNNLPWKQIYPNGSPTIKFDENEQRISGFAGCNNYTGSFVAAGYTLSIPDHMAMTRKMCVDGAEGEDLFTSTIGRVTKWKMSNDSTLNLLSDDITIMRFHKLLVNSPE